MQTITDLFLGALFVLAIAGGAFAMAFAFIVTNRRYR